MTRPTNFGRGLANQSSAGLGGSITPPPSDDITYGGHVGTDVEAALDGRPPTHTSASDPTTGDDSGDGHVIGCRWINTATDEEFVATDVTVAAAVWLSTTTGSGGSVDVTDGTTTVSPASTIDFDPTYFDVTAPGGGVAEVTFVGTPGSTVDIEDEGAAEGAADTIDFVGAGVSVAFSGGTATVTISGGGGGGVDYILDIDVDGSSATGWNAHGGTWSSNGTEIIQTDTGAAWRIYRFGTTKINAGYTLIFEAEMQVVSGSGGIQRLGIGTSDSTGGANGFNLNLDVATNSLAFDKHNAASIFTAGVTFDPSIWYKLRFVTTSAGTTAYVDGTQIESGFNIAQGGWNGGTYLCLFSYGVSGMFRNIKVWSLSDGAPA
jgi:hypothetical protein